MHNGLPLTSFDSPPPGEAEVDIVGYGIVNTVNVKVMWRKNALDQI